MRAIILDGPFVCEGSLRIGTCTLYLPRIFSFACVNSRDVSAPWS
jgi:hypothetical protein